MQQLTSLVSVCGKCRVIEVSEEFTIANTNGLVAITYQYPMCIYTNMKKQQQQKQNKRPSRDSRLHLCMHIATVIADDLSLHLSACLSVYA